MGEDVTGGQYGPSWWDVERTQETLCSRYDIAVVYVATCTRSSQTGRYGWWIRAEAKRPKKLGDPAVAVGAYSFRGPGGTKTYTSAMYMALLDLEEALLGLRSGERRLPGF